MVAGAVDHCTGFPEEIAGVDISVCCADHDDAFATGGSIIDFLIANIDLGACVDALSSNPVLMAVGVIVALGTTAFGLPFWIRARWRRTHSISTASPQPALSGLFHAPQEAPMDTKVFFDDVRHTVFGGSLSQDQVDGINMTIRKCAEHAVVDRDAVANVLGQICHESGRTMRPVRETFATSDAQAASRLEAAWKAGKLPWVKTPYWRADANGQYWFGRGPIQTTHHVNYEKIDTALGLNGALLADPNLMLNADIGFDAAVVGMRDGLYTGRALGDYFGPGDDADDAHGEARRIVNGVESRAKVQALAVAFERALSRAEMPAVNPAPAPVPVPAPRPVPDTPEPTTAPTAPAAPLPANPSPTPVEQSSKSVGAGKWAAIVGTVWTTISAFLMSTPSVPEQYRDPVLLAGIGTLLTTLASIIGAYVAPQNAVPASAS